MEEYSRTAALHLAAGVQLAAAGDGTIAPWASAASLPFAPEIVLPTIEHMVHVGVGPTSCRYGFVASFNPTFPGPTPLGWVSPWNYGLNQGPIVLMVENHRFGLLWSLMRRCPHLVAGLRQAGYSGGWLGNGGDKVQFSVASAGGATQTRGIP